MVREAFASHDACIFTVLWHGDECLFESLVALHEKDIRIKLDQGVQS